MAASVILNQACDFACWHFAAFAPTRNFVAYWSNSEKKILDMDRQISACHRSSEMCRRLTEIPGIGPLLVTALVATVPDPRAFASARNFAACIGLVPKQNSSGGKEQLGGITKQGNRCLRSMLTVGARNEEALDYIAPCPLTTKVAAVALANEMARMTWATMAKGRRYREPVAVATERSDANSDCVSEVGRNYGTIMH